MVVGETEGESQPRCCMFMLDGRIIGKYDEAQNMCVAKMEIQSKNLVMSSEAYA